jgi:hypothetical protein
MAFPWIAWAGLVAFPLAILLVLIRKHRRGE